ncbi:hypothetical protein PFISCL1PPCAC_9146, partial [Pristionchus fissidentatus]
DYDTPREDVSNACSPQLTTDQLLLTFIAKDTPIEVVRVPSHILNEMLHTEPMDEILTAGEVDVTRINLTQLRALLEELEQSVETVPLSRWRCA